jgi:hypothetical protein
VFNVAIQPGAILAIVVLYWRTFMQVLDRPVQGVMRAAIAFIATCCWPFSGGGSRPRLQRRRSMRCWKMRAWWPGR